MSSIPTFQQDSASKFPEQTSTGGAGSIDTLDLIHRYRFWIAAGTAIGLVLGYLAYKKLGPVFLAESQVLVSRKVNVPIKQDARTTFGERSVHVTLIKSPLIIGRAFEEGKLGELETLKKSKEPIQDISTSLKVTRLAGEDHSEQNVLGLEYRNRNKNDAEAILNAIVKSYKDYLKETSSENATEMVKRIEEATGELSDDLAKKMAAYDKFRAEAPVQFKNATGLGGGTTSNVVNIHQDQVDAISAELRLVRIRQMTLNSQQQTLEEAVKDGESPEALQMLVRQFMQTRTQGAAGGGGAATAGAPISGGRVSLETQLIPLMLEEQKLMRGYGDAHPEVQNVRQRILTLLRYYKRQGVTVPSMANRLKKGSKSSIDPGNLTAIYVQSIKRQLIELNHRQQFLDDAFKTSFVKAKEYARYQTIDQSMSEDVERTKSLFNIVSKQWKEVGLDKENKGYRLKQILPVRSEVDFKRVLKFMGGGGFMGLLSILVFAYLKELQDTTVKSMNEVKDVMGESILGSVPTFTDPAVNLKAARLSGLDPMLYYVHQPGSAEAESYRSVRTALFVRAATENAHVLQVTSAEPGDGKTTSICNLAAAVAQSGKRVLLIDADLRRPTVHKIFGLNDQIGLSTVLGGDTNFLQSVQSTQIAGLSVMASGALPDKPAEMLASRYLPQLVDWARENYDIVFIDSPPVLAVSDPCIIAPMTDGLLLVVRMHKNKRASLLRVKETLASHGVKTLGIVTNGIAPNASGDYTYAGEYAGRYGASTSVRPVTSETSDAPQTSVPTKKEPMVPS